MIKCKEVFFILKNVNFSIFEFLNMKAFMNSIWRALLFDIKCASARFKWDCSYRLKSYRQTDGLTDRQTGKH